MADATVEEMQCYDLLTSNCQIFCNKMLKRMDMPEFKMTYDSEPDTINRTFDMITEDLIGTSKPTVQNPPASCLIAIPSPSSNNNLKLTDASKPTGQSAPSAYSMPLPSSSPNSELNTNVSEAKLPCSMPVKSSRFTHGSAPMTTTKHEFKKAVPVLSVSDLEAVHKILIPIKDDWKGIGNSLHVDPGTLLEIMNIYKISEDCLREMLREYLQKRNPLPMWQELVQAAERYNQAVANSISRRAEYIRA